MKKSSGPRTMPCGTPVVTGVQLLKVWLMQTLWRRPANQFRIHWAALNWMPCAMTFTRSWPSKVQCFLKVQVDEVHCFVVIHVVGVNDTGKEVKQACLAAALLSEAMLRVAYQVVALKVCDYLAFN